MTPALKQFAMVCLTVPHEHLPAGAVGVVLDIYGDAAHVQFHETVCPDGFDSSVKDLLMVPLAHLRLAEADDYPPEPLTIEEQFDAMFPEARVIVLDYEEGEMMELLRTLEGQAVLCDAIDEAVAKAPRAR